MPDFRPWLALDAYRIPLILLLLVSLMAGCAPPVIPAPIAASSGVAGATATTRPDPTPSIATTVTVLSEPATLEPCGYQWASQALPAETEILQAALDRAGLGGFVARAEAFGENCVTASGQVASFLTMQTDFRLQAEAIDIADDAALGAQIEAVLEVLRSFPPGVFPGPQRGYLGIQFTQGEQVRNLWFRLAAADQALEDGYRGADLVKKLSAGE